MGYNMVVISYLLTLNENRDSRFRELGFDLENAIRVTIKGCEVVLSWSGPTWYARGIGWFMVRIASSENKITCLFSLMEFSKDSVSLFL